MVNFNILKPSRPVEREESLEELLSIYEEGTKTDDVVFTSMEEALIQFQQYLQLSRLSNEELQDPALQSLLSVEAIDIHKVKHSIISSAKNVGSKLAQFAAWVHDTLKSRVVSERYIVKRFAELDESISRADTTRAYVEDVPTFETVQTRLIGIIQVCEYVKELSSKQDTTAGYSDGMFEKLAITSKGVLKLDTPYGNTTYRNLSWNPPIKDKYELLRSPWSLPVNTQKIRNLVIQAKYDALDDLGKAAKVLAKRCSSFKEETMYEAPDYNEVANTYNAAYVINKATKQIEKAITREINNLMITTMARLIHYTTI